MRTVYLCLAFLAGSAAAFEAPAPVSAGRFATVSVIM